MVTKNYAGALAAGVLVLLTLASCGTGRPDIDELATALQKPDSIVPVTAERADCVAQVLHDSNVSDETLKAITEGDANYSASGDEQNTLTQALAEAQTACV